MRNIEISSKPKFWMDLPVTISLRSNTGIFMYIGSRISYKSISNKKNLNLGAKMSSKSPSRVGLKCF